MLRDETIRRVVQFRDDRDWRQFHTPKDLAISMSLEAAELLELFQWSGTDVECRDKVDKVREELADVLEVVYAMAAVCVNGYMNVGELLLYLIRLIANLFGCAVGCGQLKSFGLALVASAQ